MQPIHVQKLSGGALRRQLQIAVCFDQQFSMDRGTFLHCLESLHSNTFILLKSHEAA